jgi:hypothetical protein
LQNHTSPIIQAGASILGAVGFVSDDEKRRGATTIAFKSHQLPPAAHRSRHRTNHEKEIPHVVEGNGAAAIATATTDTEETAVESEGETEGDIASLGNAQLAILIFGFCGATFTVAFGEWLSCHLTSPCCFPRNRYLDHRKTVRTRLKVQERLNNDPGLYVTDERY